MPFFPLSFNKYVTLALLLEDHGIGPQPLNVIPLHTILLNP